MAGPGRPKLKKSFDVIGADPVLRDEEGLSPADNLVDPLTEETLSKALSQFIEAGITLKVTDKYWFIEKSYYAQQKRGLPKKQKLIHSGSIYMPAKAVYQSAELLYRNAEDIEAMLAMRAKRGAKFSGMGEVLGKDGEPLDAA